MTALRAFALEPAFGIAELRGIAASKAIVAFCRSLPFYSPADGLDIGGARPTCQDVIVATACLFRVSVTDLKESFRPNWIARPRQIAMYVCRDHLRFSYPQIGRAFNRDHTTVLSNYRAMRALCESDPAWESRRQMLIKALPAATARRLAVAAEIMACKALANPPSL